jgi:hypothetical protein
LWRAALAFAVWAIDLKIQQVETSRPKYPMLIARFAQSSMAGLQHIIPAFRGIMDW